VRQVLIMSTTIVDSTEGASDDDQFMRSLSSKKLSMKYHHCIGGMASLVNDIARLLHTNTSEHSKLQKALGILREAYQVNKDAEALLMFFKERKEVFRTEGSGVEGKEPQNVVIVANLLFPKYLNLNLPAVGDDDVTVSEFDDERSRMLSHSIRSMSVSSRFTPGHVHDNDSISTIIMDPTIHEDEVAILRPFQQVYIQKNVEEENAPLLKELKELKDKIKIMELNHKRELQKEKNISEKMQDKVQRMMSSYDALKQSAAEGHHIRDQLKEEIKNKEQAFLQLSKTEQIYDDLQMMYRDLEQALSDARYRELEIVEKNHNLESDKQLAAEENEETVRKLQYVEKDRDDLKYEIEELKRMLNNERRKPPPPVAPKSSGPGAGDPNDPNNPMHQAVKILHIEIDNLKKIVEQKEKKYIRISNEKVQLNLKLQERRKQCGTHTCPGAAGANYKARKLEEEIDELIKENNRLRMKVNEMIDNPNTVVVTIKERVTVR